MSRAVVAQHRARNKALSHVVAALFGAAWIGLVGAQESESALIGRWQYIQPPDKEGEVLDISFSNGRFRATMNGLERAGEHGLFYYVVEPRNLTVAPASISFYDWRAIVVQQEARAFECEGAGNSCPDSTLRFKRIPTPGPASR